MRAYLGGPMSNRPQFNFPAFDAAAADLRERGHEILSPAEMDDDDVREAALASPDGAPGSAPGRWEDFLARDIQVVCDPDTEAVIVLDGWEQSKGAQFEVDVARRLGKPILRYPDLEPIAEAEAQGGEVRVTDPKTGGQKGRKPERYDLIPWGAMDEVARVYGFGANKYESWNWAKGYSWSLSTGAALRHLTAFAAGEDLDPESELPHLAHAVFHMLALITFRQHGLGADDRWPGPGADPGADDAGPPCGRLFGTHSYRYMCELDQPHDGPCAAPSVGRSADE